MFWFNKVINKLAKLGEFYKNSLNYLFYLMFYVHIPKWGFWGVHPEINVETQCHHFWYNWICEKYVAKNVPTNWNINYFIYQSPVINTSTCQCTRWHVGMKIATNDQKRPKSFSVSYFPWKRKKMLVKKYGIGITGKSKMDNICVCCVYKINNDTSKDKQFILYVGLKFMPQLSIFKIHKIPIPPFSKKNPIQWKKNMGRWTN